MVKTRTVEMQTQLVGYEFKEKGLPTDKNIAVENSKVSNDYFWKTNEYTDKDVFGRTLDLTALINKPDGYLKGSLSDTQDVDYYKFNITEYRALSFAKDTYNKDITITLDHIPEGCDYEMVLYDVVLSLFADMERSFELTRFNVVCIILFCNSVYY